MKCYAKTIIDWANAQVGYKEKANNINKYAEYIDKNCPDFYNGKKNGAAWCDVFFDCGMIQCFGEANALRLTCQPKHSTGAGCAFSYNFYKQKKQVGTLPKLGAQIFFGEEKPTHTGIVVKIDSKKVYTVEGNKNNQVSACSYSINSKKIFGYGYPAYDPEEETLPEPKPTEQKAEPKPTVKTKTYTVNVKAGHILRLRSQPNTNSSILAKMPRGTKVTSTEQKNGWAKVTYNKQTGWASMDYLK